MEIIGTATKVTIYVGESDRWGQKSLYMAILEMLKTEDCAGATVVRGLAGFGAHSRIHTAASSICPPICPSSSSGWMIRPHRPCDAALTEMVVEGLSPARRSRSSPTATVGCAPCGPPRPCAI